MDGGGGPDDEGGDFGGFEDMTPLDVDVGLACSSLNRCAQNAHELSDEHRAMVLAAIAHYSHTMRAMAHAMQERAQAEMREQ